MLDFPFEDIPAPAFEILVAWPLDRFLGYFSTWSAVNRLRPVRWPLHLRVGRVG